MGRHVKKGKGGRGGDLMKCRGGETGGGGGGLLKRGGGRGEPRPMAKCCDQFGSNLQSAIETRVRAGHKAGTQLYNL